MDMSKVSANIRQSIESQAKEMEEQRKVLEDDKQERIRKQSAKDRIEKHQTELVNISKEGTRDAEASRKGYADRMAGLTKQNEDNYLRQAQLTADDLKTVQGLWAKEIHDLHNQRKENLKFVSDAQQDPFYQMKSLNPILADGAGEYTVTVALPEHEARNVILGTEGRVLTLSLARRFQNNIKDDENNRITKTNSYQTVVDQLAIPGPIISDKVVREWKEGVLTFKIPKQAFTGKIEDALKKGVNSKPQKSV